MQHLCTTKSDMQTEIFALFLRSQANLLVRFVSPLSSFRPKRVDRADRQKTKCSFRVPVSAGAVRLAPRLANLRGWHAPVPGGQPPLYHL